MWETPANKTLKEVPRFSSLVGLAEYLRPRGRLWLEVEIEPETHPSATVNPLFGRSHNFGVGSKVTA